MLGGQKAPSSHWPGFSQHLSHHVLPGTLHWPPLCLTVQVHHSPGFLTTTLGVHSPMIQQERCTSGPAGRTSTSPSLRSWTSWSQGGGRRGGSPGEGLQPHFHAGPRAPPTVRPPANNRSLCGGLAPALALRTQAWRASSPPPTSKGEGRNPFHRAPSRPKHRDGNRDLASTWWGARAAPALGTPRSHTGRSHWSVPWEYVGGGRGPRSVPIPGGSLPGGGVEPLPPRHQAPAPGGGKGGMSRSQALPWACWGDQGLAAGVGLYGSL